MKQPSLPEIVQNPSCMDDYDPNAMSVKQARTFIQQYLTPITETETIDIKSALGRILAQEIICNTNVPNHDNSAMDGFAFKHADANQALKLVGTTFAGKPFTDTLKSGECIKIMTGGVIPKGADTVVMQEHAQLENNLLSINKLPPLNANIRRAGEDLHQGQIVLKTGHRLKPADIGLLASLGIAEVSVYQPLKVAFFSTGDELIEVGKPLQEGQIYDSNRYTLFSMLTHVGVIVNDFGNVADNRILLESTLLKAGAENDVVITSGGVSVGEADYMKSLLQQHGQVLFWKMNMKPGRPLAYGKLGSNKNNQAHYFGLPGNPVATMVTFFQFVRDALLTLSGAQVKPIPMFTVTCSTPIKKALGRTEFQRGLLYEESGEWKVKPMGNQSSGVLSSMSFANCFIVLDEETGNCDAGTQVKVQPFEAFS